MYRFGFCLLLLLPVFAFAKTPAEIFSMASPSIVIVRALDAQGKVISLGSGVVIASTQVVTNCHVTDKGVRMEVKSGLHTLSASIRYADRERDLCQLAVPSLTAPSIKIGSVKKIKIGARVVALGSPQGLELSLSDGLVSALREAGDASIIQTTAPISPGSSGGGLFDEEGRLIGITTFYLAEGQNLNFALPADWIAALPERAKIAKVAPPTDLISPPDDLVDTSEKATAFDESAWLLKAIALESKKDWDALLAHARAWTKANPRSSGAWFVLGNAYVDTGQNDQASKAFRETLRINPEYTNAWYNLGTTYGKLGQNDQAINAFREALRINPDDADAWINLGVAYVNTSQVDQAIKAYREALRINPKLALAWVNLGTTYADTGQDDQAIKAYREALRINPDDADAWNNLGITYGKVGQFVQAIKTFREALRINPEYADAWYNLGVAYGKVGQFVQAIKAFREALRINPEYALAWYNLGVAFWFKGESTQVMEVYRKLRALDPALADDFFNKVSTPR